MTPTDDAPGESAAQSMQSDTASGASATLAPTRARTVLVTALVFIQMGVPASWMAIIPLHLKDLGFSAAQIANVFGSFSLASILSPWIAGQLADRVTSAQRVIIACNLLNAGVLWTAASQRAYLPLLVLLAGSAMLWAPTFVLTTHITLRYLNERRERFGSIRMFGTVGWVIGSLAIAGWLSRPAWIPGAASATLSDGLRMSAIAALIAAGICLIVPHVATPAREARTKLALVVALRALRDRRVAVVMGVSFALALTSPFVYPVGGIFLRDMGFSDASIPSLLSTGQMVEVAAFALLTLMLKRFGFKTLFLMGVACWALRFAVWSVGAPAWLVVLSFGIHGICYAYVIGLGQMIVDQCAAADARASAQGLHLLLTSGLPVWPANMIAAAATTLCTTTNASGESTVNYRLMFIVPAIVCAIATLIFALAFPNRPHDIRSASAPA